MGYPVKFREKVMEYLKRGNTQKNTVQIFGISTDTLWKWKKKQKEEGTLENKPLNRKWRKIDPKKLEEFVKNNPDKFIWEYSQHFGVSKEGLRLALRSLGFRRKKTNFLRSEANPYVWSLSKK
jgi:transposase